MVKSLPASAGDVKRCGLALWVGKIPWRRAQLSCGWPQLWSGSLNAFQYSCLENSMDRGAWRAMTHGVAELDVTEAT